MTKEDRDKIIEALKQNPLCTVTEFADHCRKCGAKYGKFLDFAKWVAEEIFDENWELNKDAFAEIACRKLAKLGIVRAKGDEWELVCQYIKELPPAIPQPKTMFKSQESEEKDYERGLRAKCNFIDEESVRINIGDRVKFKTIGGWYDSGIIKDMNEESYLIEVDKSEDMQTLFPYYIRVLSSFEIISEEVEK